MLAQASTAPSAGSSVELWSRWSAIGPMTCAGGGLYETVDVGVEAAEGRRDLLDLVVGGSGVVGEVVQGHEVAAHGVGVAPMAVDVLLAAVADADAPLLFLLGAVGAGEGVQGQVGFVGGAAVAVNLPAESTVVAPVEAEGAELHVAAGAAAHTPLGVGYGGGDEATVRRPARRYISPYRSQVATWPPNGSLYATHMAAPPALSIEHRHLACSASFAAVDTIARTPSTSTTSTRLCALQDDVLPCLS